MKGCSLHYQVLE